MGLCTANGDPVEQWSQLAAAQRIPKIKIFLLALEARLNIRPVIYTDPNFWTEFINPFATPADNTFFQAFKLWVVDLKATGTLPIPWEGSSASFIQTHLGEKPATSGLYARLDQDDFSGSLKDLLNFTAPGFTIMRGFPFSNIVKDLQIELIQKRIADRQCGWDFWRGYGNSREEFSERQSIIQQWHR